MKSVTIQDVKLHVIALPLVELLKTSFGAEPYKSAIIVEVVDSEGLTGWGETALKTKPAYGSETILTALHITRDFLIPQLRGGRAQLADRAERPGQVGARQSSCARGPRSSYLGSDGQGERHAPRRLFRPALAVGP